MRYMCGEVCEEVMHVCEEVCTCACVSMLSVIGTHVPGLFDECPPTPPHR